MVLRLRRWLRSFRWFINGAADDDPSGIATYFIKWRAIWIWHAMDTTIHVSADGQHTNGQRAHWPRYWMGLGGEPAAQSSTMGCAATGVAVADGKYHQHRRDITAMAVMLYTLSPVALYMCTRWLSACCVCCCKYLFPMNAMCVCSSG